ncbi:uncharacterized protein LOC125947912 [Anopheles darlingi]|uniref:uncharacterized protein LOC125947912 n=1 Tax=Anopheles darlingi TaxID=43151 RepID=UPI0021000507|nr:uncharacterized protein LOC125947912 [Anopheles darlingi]
MMNANILMNLGTTVIPSVVIVIVLIFTLANLYLNIRRRFPVKVNCWFCNANTSVPYDQANSFVCPSCAQYNGFTADGDYNREIPEQYQQRYHGRYCYTQPRNITDDDKWGTTRSVASAGNNGLCFGCNRNQELKIHQLASFVPEDENNYDAEVEDYRKQLEQAYKLCGRCERILKRTLNDVKRNILGSKLAQIGSKGLSVLDMHIRASSKQIARLNRQRWARLCVYAITLLVALKLPQEFSDAGWAIADIVALCPAPLMNLGTNLLSYMLALYQLINDQVGRLLAEPAIQHTTERIETLGVELFQMYGTPLVCTPKQFFDSFTEQVANNQDASVLLNVAIIALAAMLASLGSQRTALKQIVIITLALVDCFLRYEYRRIDLGLYFSLIALALAVSCIGQRSIRSDVADGNLNSSFHKIYSQQCSEADYSDADTTAGNQSFKHGPDTDSATTACQVSPPTPYAVANASRKSLDTTKSCSPSSTFSLSTMNPFYTSGNGHSPTSVGMETSKISGSLFNMPEAVNEVASSSASVFNRSTNAGSSSLLKTPSFSVADFSKVTPQIGSRTADDRHQSLKGGGGFHHSMSIINRQAMQSLREDPLIEDDIDRLSISGRASLNASRSSRMSLGGSNPFAQIDHDTASSATLRRRRIVPPLEMFPVVEESPWSQVTATGEVGATVLGQPHMSRTSSQSSGFESQSATRRNTPTEVDALSVYTGADSTLRHEQPPSPVPSSASVLYRNPGNSMPWSSNHRQQQHHHSLFSHQSLFKHAAYQPPFNGPTGGGLFFTRPTAYHTATNGFSSGSVTGSTTSSSAASTAHRNFGHIFPPQQSQTPSYHYHHHHQQQPSTLANNNNSLLLNSSFLGASVPTTTDRSSLFNTTATVGFSGTVAGSVTPQPPHPSFVGASFSGSTTKATTAKLRASLLDLAKLNNELNEGKVMPTA